MKKNQKKKVEEPFSKEEQLQEALSKITELEEEKRCIEIEFNGMKKQRSQADPTKEFMIQIQKLKSDFEKEKTTISKSHQLELIQLDERLKKKDGKRRNRF